MAKTFIAALREYFGVLPTFKGQAGLQGFAAEIKELTEQDRIEIGAAMAEEFKTEITDIVRS